MKPPPASQGGLPWVARVLKVGLEFYVMPVIRRLGSPRSQRFAFRRFDVSSRDWKPLGSKRWALTKRMCFPRSIRWLPPMVRWKLKDKQRTKSRIDGFFLVKVNFQILGENLTLLQFYPFSCLLYTDFFLFPKGFTFRTKRSFLKVLDHGCACTNLYGCRSNMACKLSGESDQNLQRIDAASMPRSSRADSAMVTLAGRWSTEFIVLFVCCIHMCYIYIYNIHMYHAFRIHI